MKIVVLLGGISTEREVSINSGEKVSKALKGLGHDVIPVDVFFGLEKKIDFTGDYDIDAEVKRVRELSKDVEKSVKARQNFIGDFVFDICKKADIVFMALHGENGENGKVQAYFDLEGIKYTGTGYLGSAVAMDKWLSKFLFMSNNINTAKGKVVFSDGREISVSDNLQYPLVVKPCSGGSSVGVSIVKDESEYQAAIDEAVKYEDKIIIEEYIDGREFTCAVLDGAALPVVEIAPKNGWYDYKNKYIAGATDEICPAQISEELTKKIQEVAVKVGEALELNVYFRADFRVDKDENVFCLEANTLPGMTNTSLIPQEAKAVGIEYDELCEKIIDISMKKYR